MKEGLNRVAKWAAAICAALGLLAAFCYWGLGISGQRVAGTQTFTVTEVLVLMAGAAALVAMYCWTHANDDDIPRYS